MTDSVPINTHKLIIISLTFGRGVEGTMSRVDFFCFLFFFRSFYNNKYSYVPCYPVADESAYVHQTYTCNTSTSFETAPTRLQLLNSRHTNSVLTAQSKV